MKVRICNNFICWLCPTCLTTLLAAAQDRVNRPGVIKINIDGSCPGSPPIPALGVIVRDTNGLVLFGFGRPVPFSNDTAIVEAHSLVAGIRCASVLPNGDIIMESDLRNLVAQLLSQYNDLSMVSFHLVAARELLASHPHIKVCYVRPSADQVVHSLAHWGSSTQHDLYFDSDCPSFLTDFVLNDAIKA
ncbi:hypothetical protein F3Y22_tig00110226pilonHSYRG00086 [Hibiscus syriacus]|uniref:RNase H type-1 domain-containing protein n=1 Tax=Hibiscus syriacus TaxID=106335 RepID=A0A6A3B8V9_HIBSY|nr:hypothetical protein F3Y22_tig00110226pilonHSYRG00086 [Hibiscus syriacus]